MRNMRKLAFGLAIFAALVCTGTLAEAQQQPAPLKVTKIKDNVYWVQGGAGSNDGIIVGTTGVIVVDTKTTTDSEKDVIAEIAKITPKAVNTAIITHSDGDHVNGLAAFPAGLTIIAQENCKKEMEASAGSRNPAPQDRLPTKTYDKTDKLTIDGVHIRLYHWAPGHTSGDTVVYLPDQKVVFGGDLLVDQPPGRYPDSLGKEWLRRGMDRKCQGHARPRCRYLLDRARQHDDQGRRAEKARSHSGQVQQDQSHGRARQVARRNQDLASASRPPRRNPTRMARCRRPR